MTNLSSLTHCMETVLIRKCFIFQFCTEVKFATLDGNLAIDYVYMRTKYAIISNNKSKESDLIAL